MTFTLRCLLASQSAAQKWRRIFKMKASLLVRFGGSSAAEWSEESGPAAFCVILLLLILVTTFKGRFQKLSVYFL